MSFSGLINSIRNMSHPQNDNADAEELPRTRGSPLARTPATAFRTDGTDDDVPGLTRTDMNDATAPAQVNPVAVYDIPRPTTQSNNRNMVPPEGQVPSSELIGNAPHPLQRAGMASNASNASTAGSEEVIDVDMDTPTVHADDEGTAFKALNPQEWSNFVSDMSADPSSSTDPPVAPQVTPPAGLAADVEMTVSEASVMGYEHAPPATPRDLANSRRVEPGYSLRNIEVNRAAEAAFEAGAIDLDLMRAAKGHGKGGLRLVETLASNSVAPSAPVRMDLDDNPGESPRDTSPESEFCAEDIWTRATAASRDTDGIVHETSEEVMGNSAPWPMSSLLPATSSWSPTAQPAAAGEGTPPGPAVDVWNSFAAVDGHSQGTLTVTLNDQMQVAEQLYGAPHAITSTLEDPSALRSDYQSIISPPDPGMFTK